MPISFRPPASILKNGQKRPFFDGRVNNFARGTRFTVNDCLYSRPILPLSNGVYHMSLRLAVAEQSTQDRSGVAPFFDPVNFLGANVKPMANNGARDHVPTAARLSQGVLILKHYISHLRLPHAKIWRIYVQ